MSVILETGRLLLRPPRAADISHFVPLLKDFRRGEEPFASSPSVYGG